MSDYQKLGSARRQHVRLGRRLQFFLFAFVLVGLGPSKGGFLELLQPCTQFLWFVFFRLAPFNEAVTYLDTKKKVDCVKQSCGIKKYMQL